MGGFRLCGNPWKELVQDFSSHAPTESLENNAGEAYDMEKSVADPGKDSVCRDLPYTQIYVLKCEFPDDNAMLLVKIPQGSLRNITGNDFTVS